MRVVADTNIWFRGLFRTTSYPGQVIDAWLGNRFTLVTSEPLLAELADVLARPRTRSRYKITPVQADQLLTSIRLLAEIVTITGHMHLCRDPDDDMFVETALVGRADLIVTQDEDLLSLAIPGLQIVNAWEFIQRLNAPA